MREHLAARAVASACEDGDRRALRGEGRREREHRVGLDTPIGTTNEQEVRVVRLERDPIGLRRRRIHVRRRHERRRRDADARGGPAVAERLAEEGEDPGVGPAGDDRQLLGHRHAGDAVAERTPELRTQRRREIGRAAVEDDQRPRLRQAERERGFVAGDVGRRLDGDRAPAVAEVERAPGEGRGATHLRAVNVGVGRARRVGRGQCVRAPTRSASTRGTGVAQPSRGTNRDRSTSS